MKQLTLEELKKQTLLLEIEPFDLLLKDFETLKAIKPFIFSPVTSEIEDLETYWDSALYYLDKGYAIETYHGSSYEDVHKNEMNLLVSILL